MGPPSTPTFNERITVAPVAGEAGRQRLDAFAASCGSDALAQLLRTPRVAALLAGTFESSPFLMALATRDAERLLRVLTASPEELFAALTREVEAAMASAPGMAEAKSALRKYKSTVALQTGLADLGGVWPVMTVTRVLTECADAAVATAVRFLFRRAVEAGQWTAADPVAPDAGSGFFALAMGKQGAFELNYSSDIDFIVFFERDKATFTGSGDLQSFFVRLTRDLVVLLEERTPEGYVFRTDLRLRPDAGATQIALSTAAAHSYYETVGQNWERAAMIKARPVAGDLNAGQEFLDELMPFVWRKYLDFAAIADVHAMKRQIHAHKDIGAISVLGQNVKLGRGGIREIEFFVQTQQLIAGGRQPDLRVRGTLEALNALAKRGWVKPDVAREMADAYRYLRQLEHRLQMIADEQTHDMPSDEQGLERIAHFSGYANAEEFGRDLTRVLETVERHYAGLFEDAPILTTGANMVFAGATDDPATIEALKGLGYSRPAQVLGIVRGWHHGRTPSVRSPRARELLTEVQPLLISALADTIDPDAAIASFDRFLAELPAGVQLFSLLKAHPGLLRLIADIMGSAPRLARILSKRRRLLDAVLDPQAIGGDVNSEAICEMLKQELGASRIAAAGDPMQDILDTARIVGSEQAFLVGVGLLTGSLSAKEAGAAYTTVAECLVVALLDEVNREMIDDHGHVPGGAAVVVGMGKLGGREMTASSDLDLILIYDFDPEATQSDGPKPLAPQHYYTRLTQRLINAISAPTAQGTLYEVDMRLRPSGQKGPVATRLSSFTSYQETEAWTWEHMALTRARVIAGSPDLGARVDKAIRQVLRRPRDAHKTATDVREMRERIASEKGTANIWNLKQVRGGQVDLEFIAQYLQLVHGAHRPEMLDPTTLNVLDSAFAAGVLSSADHARLEAAGRLIEDLTQLLRLCLDGPFLPVQAPAGLKVRLAKTTRSASFDELENKLKQTLAGVAEAFDRLIA